MPKSQKPRKQHHKRWQTQKVIIDPKEIEAIKSEFSNIELAVEMKLPRGAMTMNDAQCLRTMINLGTILLFYGYGFERSYCQETYGHTWRRMQDGFHSCYPRAIDQEIFTPTGDELNAIRDRH